MKKLIVFLFLGLCLCTTSLAKLEKNPLFEANGVEKVCFVCDQHFEIDGFEVVDCGDMSFNFCKMEVARENLNRLKKNLIGLQFYFQSVDCNSVLSQLDAEVVSTENIDGLVVLNCFTPYYDKCIFVNGKKVNLQIATNCEQVVAGFPVLLTGF